MEHDDAALRGGNLPGWDSPTLDDLVDHLSWAIGAEVGAYHKGGTSNAVRKVIAGARDSY